MIAVPVRWIETVGDAVESRDRHCFPPLPEHATGVLRQHPLPAAIEQAPAMEADAAVCCA
jgi:hypothetical protein